MTAFPDWSSFTPESAVAALSNSLELARSEFRAIEKRCDPATATFESLVWSVNDATRPLFDTWGMVSHMLSVMNSPEWRKVEDDWQPKIVEFSLELDQSRPHYVAIKAAAARESDPIRRRILEKSAEGAEKAGVGLEGAQKDRYNEIQRRLSRLCSDFANTVIDATAAYKYEKDGKTYTIDDANYPETMKHCADREVREQLFRARSHRAPENEARISEILSLRSEEAKLLGYPDYASLSLSSKCAPSVDAVMKMIGDLDVATEKPAADEAAALGDSLEPWDIAYEAERLRERRYSYSEDELKRYFECEKVLDGLFRMTKFLFGVEVVEVKGADKPSVWHPDVRFFAVKEGDETIAYFYVDPFVRNGLKRGGAWMNEFRNRCDRLNMKPVAVLVMNFPIPDADGRCLLPYREVETVFHEFGHALQCMLTRIGEEDASGINLVEWDAVEVASQFMENWCLDARTCIEVPEELKAKVKAAKNFRAATICRRQLAFAKTDLELHIAGLAESPDAVKRRNFEHFGMPTVDGDRFLCSFTHIFAGGYAAGYYGYKWAEVMSADAFGRFEEAGIADDESVRRIGREYRETILALGGSMSALEVFRRFRGRDPEIDALLVQTGLK